MVRRSEIDGHVQPGGGPFPLPPRLVAFDLDGVVYRGGLVLPGAREALDCVLEHGLALRYVTNNPTKHREEVAILLRDYGFPAEPEFVLTSGAATASWLAGRLEPGARVLMIGEAGLRRELEEQHLSVVHAHEAGASAAPGSEASFAAVVVSLDRSFDYAALAAAQAAVLQGALLVGTNRDLTFPAEGRLLPGGGSLLVAVEAASGREPVIIGKPYPGLAEGLQRSAGISPAETLFVGDRLDTDIDFGLKAGMQTVLVLTGVSQRADLVDGAPRPHHVLEDLKEFPGLLRRLRSF